MQEVTWPRNCYSETAVLTVFVLMDTVALYGQKGIKHSELEWQLYLVSMCTVQFKRGFIWLNICVPVIYTAVTAKISCRVGKWCYCHVAFLSPTTEKVTCELVLISALSSELLWDAFVLWSIKSLESVQNATFCPICIHMNITSRSLCSCAAW